MNFNNVIGEYLKYFFVIDNISIYKSIVKFVISLTSLIIKSAQLFEKDRSFIKFWAFYNGMIPFFFRVNIFCGGVLRPRPWASPGFCTH